MSVLVDLRANALGASRQGNRSWLRHPSSGKCAPRFWVSVARSILSWARLAPRAFPPIRRKASRRNEVVTSWGAVAIGPGASSAGTSSRERCRRVVSEPVPQRGRDERLAAADFARWVEDSRIGTGLHLITGGNARSRAQPEHVGGTRRGSVEPSSTAEGAFCPYIPWL